MNGIDTRRRLDECLAIYLSSLPLPGRDLSSADAERGQGGRRCLVEAGEASVPVLLDRLAASDFHVKDACHDLVLEIGNPAKDALRGELGRRGPIMDIWIASMLRHMGDEGAMDRLWPYLQHPDGRVRHLTALALAFRSLDSGAEPSATLLVALLESLDDERTIEGTPFTVAGSALACLSRFSGESFLSSPREVQFYNYEHFAYPPPLHPFPFAADHFTMADEAEKRRVRERVGAWITDRSRPTPVSGNPDDMPAAR